MTLRLLDQAREELRQSALWYEKKREGLGDEFVSLVERAFETIERNPRQFPRLETNLPAREIRKCVIKRFPFLVIFEIVADEVLVIAVAHGKRKPYFWKERLDSQDEC